MHCTHFTYNGDSTEDHGVMICSFNGGDEEPVSGGKIEMITFKAPNSNKWIKTNATYKEPLTFSFEICKNPCTASLQDEFVFSPADQIEMQRWLERKEFHYLTFDDGDMEDIYFNSQIKLTEQKNGGQIIGYKLDVTCDAPWGWSEERVANISSSDTTTIELCNWSDETCVIFPTVKIFCKEGTVESPQDIIIRNNLTKTKMEIKNCVAGEVILIHDRKIESSECYETPIGFEGKHSTLCKDFNWNWLSIGFSIGNTCDERGNELTVTGNCDIQLSWREPRKAVL